MKKICFLLVFALLLGSLTGCGLLRLKPEATEKPAVETDAPATEPTAVSEPELTPDALPDFTVQTVNGEPFTLSDALKTHALVVINLFATWCPPCRMEFPYLEEAWEQQKDSVSVIALSIEPEDTDEDLRSYAEELGLHFPVGHEDGTDLSRFVTEGIPTTLLVDRTGKVVWVECGAKTSTQAFLDLFDGYTGEDYDPSLLTYTVGAYDVDTYEYVAGVVVNFCTDTACTPVVTTADGAVTFTGPRAAYHVQVVKIPDGWELFGDAEFDAVEYGGAFWIPLWEVGG